MAPRPAGTLNGNGVPYADQQGSLADEQAWVRGWIDETYLWYADVRALPAATLDRRQYTSAVSFFDVLKSPAITASGKPKDAFHYTYDTAAWQAMAGSGVSYSYGFDVSLISTTPPRQAVVSYTVPNTPADQAGIGRGAQILAVDGVDLVNDGTGSGVDVLNAGLFPEAAGSHTFQILDRGSTTARTVTLTAAPLELPAVQNVKTLPAPYQTVGYLQFNQHVAPAESQLVDAIKQFQAANVSDVILDMRYNGGGYLDIASELSFMIAGPAATAGAAFEQLSFNDKNPFQLSTSQRTTPFFSVSQGFSLPSGQALPYLGLNRVYVLAGRDLVPEKRTPC